MNKTDLIVSVAEKTGLSKANAKKAVDAVVESISDALIANEKVILVGFGTFSLKEHCERTAINPATKAKITVPAKKSVKFKVGRELADAVVERTEDGGEQDGAEGEHGRDESGYLRLHVVFGNHQLGGELQEWENACIKYQAE